jgi:hypothetical protein
MLCKPHPRAQAGLTGPVGSAQLRPRRRPSVRSAVLVIAALALLPANASASARQANFNVPAGPAVGSGKVSCPPGERATGGGYIADVTGGNARVIGTSRKVGQSTWSAAVGSYDGGSSTARVYVYCSAQAPQTTEVSKTTPVSDSAETPVAASCDGLGTVQAGGFSTPARKGIVVTSRRFGNTWRVRANSFLGTTPKVTSYAYCAKTKAPVAREGAPVSGTDTEFKIARSAPCAGGAAPLAGGFRQPDSFSAGGGFDTPHELRRLNGRWRARARHQQNTSSFVAIAYCP